MFSNNLNSFFTNINEKILSSFHNNNFEKLQLSLLEESFHNYQKKAEVDLFTTTLFVFYFVANTFEKKLDEKSQLLGAFCTLYVLSLDLFDDVQDDDLKGKTYEKVGPPIAINNAITLLFLSLEFLVKAIDLEEDENKRLMYLKIFNQSSIIAVKGQHKDLLGSNYDMTSQDVMLMQKEKASSVSLISRCAAIFSDCNSDLIDKFDSIFQKVALVFQLVDDIRDIFGKKISPDLLTDKVTYPIACFLELSNEEQIKKFHLLKKDLPHSLKEIRKLLYDSGSVKKVSETIESLRVDINNDLLSLKMNNPNIRTMLYMIDAFASSIYKTPIIESSRHILQPDREWDKYIKNIFDTFFVNMEKYNPPPKIELFPWHLPQWMYEPKRNLIFYSDIEGQHQEIIPFHIKSVGIDDYDFVKDLVVSEAPLVMSHELFHYWRSYIGKLTKDYWYEEYVANSLSVSYIMDFYPDLYLKSKSLINKIVESSKIKLSEDSNKILNRLISENLDIDYQDAQYNVDIEQMSLIHLKLLNHIFQKEFSLDKNIIRFL